MASLGRAGQLLLRIHKTLQWTALPFQKRSFYNKDFQPGPYPETETERRAAAKKYNMVYEDYKPYPKDIVKATDFPVGDYPQLEPVSQWSRDPHGNYEFPVYKRNYGEPLNFHFDLYTPGRYDISNKVKVASWMQGVYLTATILSIFLLNAICEAYDIRYAPHIRPAKKQYPAEGVVHYTFEPTD